MSNKVSQSRYANQDGKWLKVNQNRRSPTSFWSTEDKSVIDNHDATDAGITMMTISTFLARQISPKGCRGSPPRKTTKNKAFRLLSLLDFDAAALMITGTIRRMSANT
jgi:hypothetical protein